MGSFYMSCAVSGLAIRDYEKVKLFFISDEQNDGHCCYPTSLYRFASLGIDAEYNDYGRYLIDPLNPEWIEFVRFLNEEGVHIEAGENQYHDNEVNPKDFTPEDAEAIFDAIHNGRLKIKHWSNKEGLMINTYPIDMDIFNDVIMRPFKSWRGGTYTVERMVEEYKETVFKEHEDFMVTLRRVVEEQYAKGKMSEEDYTANMEKFAAKEEDRYYSLGNSKFHLDDTMNWNANFGEYVYKNGKDYSLAKIAEMRFLFNVHYTNNIMVTPQMSGGQEHNFDNVADFHVRVAQVAEMQSQKWNREYGEEEMDECCDTCQDGDCNNCTK